ncbi:hypothetical protein PLANPX_5308 [Lacipirellula parvula]|uniref:Uncharacterized protein n=1 Tax=Lacipirellula parvula TaxID=2650471 RepID=A0A5K7XLW8_9BACT|nr:hypothetical protein PLANPX_5308 [Lacipirellula parvula]
MRPMQRNDHPRRIQITGRNVLCDTFDDRELLAQAKAVVLNPATADTLSLENLYVIRDACQRYALGKAQRALKIAIDIRTLPGPQ